MRNGSDRIKCNVTKCVHNCIEDSTCRLDSIVVCECMKIEKVKIKKIRLHVDHIIIVET